jgi:dsDNA-binding SOS-regulon protein
MSSGVSNDSLIDLLRTTQTNLPDMDFEVALKYQDWIVVNEWFGKEKIEEDSGTSIVRNIVLDNNGNARMVRLYQKTSLNQGDTQRQITAPWCQVQSYYNVHRQEMLRNRKKAKFIDLVESKRLDGMLSLAELLEERAIKAPENSSDDLNPYGLPYWLNKAPTRPSRAPATSSARPPATATAPRPRRSAASTGRPTPAGTTTRPPTPRWTASSSSGCGVRST